MHDLPQELGRQSGSLVEREQELATLLAALGDATAGRGSFALVTGEPGIGKSRLCSELVAEASRRGFATLQATADPLTLGIPLATLATAVTAEDPAARAEFMPHVATPAGIDGASTSELFHVLVRLLGGFVKSSPTLLVLDDIEYLDDGTCQALRYVDAWLSRHDLLIVLAGRPAVGSALVSELAGFVRQEGRSVSPRRLTEEAITTLLSAVAVSAPGNTDDASLARIAGLPLYAQSLVEEGSGGQPAHPGQPTRVAARIEREVQRLSAEERTLFDVLAVAGEAVPFDVLAAVGGGGDEERAAALRGLINRQLVVASGDTAGESFVLAHPMYAEWVDGALFGHERRLVHAAIGRALRESTRDVKTAASHLLAAGAAASGPDYVPALLEAARSAEALGSDDDVVTFLRPLVDIPSAFPSSSELAERLEDLGRAQVRAGAVEDAEETWRRGVKVALECQDASRAESIRYRLAMLRVQKTTVPEELIELRVTRHEDEGAAVRELWTLVWSGRFGDAQQMRAAAQRLLAVRPDNGSAAAQCASELGRCVLDVLDGESAGAHRHAERALALAQQTPHTFLINSSSRMLSRVSVLAGDLIGARTLAESQLRDLLSTGNDESSLRVWLGLLRYFSGDLIGAAEQAALAASAGAASAVRTAASASTLTALIAAERGHGSRMRARLADVQRTYREGMSVDRGLSSFADAARSTLALQIGAPERVPDPRPDTFDAYPQVMCLRPLLAGLAGVAMAQPGRTVRQAEVLRSRGRTSPVCNAFALRLEGLAAIASGRQQSGAEQLREASTQLALLGIRLHAAQTVVEWAESGAPAVSSEDSAGLIRDALASFDEQGVRFWGDRARAVARTLGMEPAPSRSRSALTAREIEVAGLVARGMSNAAIARHLFLSERTVETHMRHIYATLGLKSRLEIARWLDLEEELDRPD